MTYPRTAATSVQLRLDRRALAPTPTLIVAVTLTLAPTCPNPDTNPNPSPSPSPTRTGEPKGVLGREPGAMRSGCGALTFRAGRGVRGKAAS